MPVGVDGGGVAGSAGNLVGVMDVLTSEDLVIAISFGRCVGDMVHGGQRSRSRGVATFGITDGSTTPIALHCDAHLLVPISSPSFTGSYVAPMALINAITLACTHLQPKRALAILRHTEQDYRSGDRWYQEPLRAATDRGPGRVPSRPTYGGRPRRPDANGRSN